jgi:hypothetical protein
MRFYFDAPSHEAGFVWLKSGYNVGIEVTSGLGSARMSAEFHIRRVPESEEDQVLLCRKAIAQFLREVTGRNGQYVSTLDDAIVPWKGELVVVAPRKP